MHFQSDRYVELLSKAIRTKRGIFQKSPLRQSAVAIGPQNIKITDNAIIPLKKRIADRCLLHCAHCGTRAAD